MTHAFIDRTCPSCNGHGCDACHGGGLVGSYESVPDIHLPAPSPWADSVRKFRERSGLSIRAMGEQVGLTPSQWSELERGIMQPTEEQRAGIDAMMNR